MTNTKQCLGPIRISLQIYNDAADDESGYNHDTDNDRSMLAFFCFWQRVCTLAENSSVINRIGQDTMCNTTDELNW